MIKVDDVNKVKDLGTSKTRKASGGEKLLRLSERNNET